MFVYHVEGVTQGCDAFKFVNIVSDTKLSKTAAALRAEEELGIRFTDVSVCSIGD